MKLNIVNGYLKHELVAYVVSAVPSQRHALGDKIRVCRKHAKLTQEALAENEDLSVVFISLLENGRRTVSVDSLRRIAKVLKVELEYLVSGIK